MGEDLSSGLRSRRPVAVNADGRGEAAAFLARRGARLDLEGAAGTGRLEDVKSFFKKDGGLKANATKRQVELGLQWACEYGRKSVVAFLLQKGMDVAAQPHGETGLHWAAYGGHADIVELLLKRKAPLHIKDRRFGGTPLGWALHGWCYPPPEAHGARHHEVVALLTAAGNPTGLRWIAEHLDPAQLKKLRSDRRMLSALGVGKLPGRMTR